MSPQKALIASQFGERLAGLMKARGYISTGNKSGVDVNRLADVAGSTYEMARRYVEGRAIPRADKLAKIAEWLGVNQAELLYGESPRDERANRVIHTEVLQSCIKAAKEAEQLSGRELNPEQMAKLVALLYEEAVEGHGVSGGLIRRLLRIL